MIRSSLAQPGFEGQKMNSLILASARRLTCLVMAGILSLSLMHRVNADSSDVLTTFKEHIAQVESISGDQKANAQKVFAERVDESGEDAVTEALMLMYPAYAKAVESADAADVEASLALLQPLTESPDKYLSADSSFYLARSLMNEERYEQSLPLLKRIKTELDEYTLHGPSAQYFIGVAQAGMLENKDAIASFMEFLEFNPMAPERLRVSAWRQIQQLQAIQDGKIEDIHQRMDFSRRRLEIADTGDSTQTEQDKIVKMLTKLIKEEEKKECSSCNSNSKQQSQQQQQQQAQNKPEPKPSKSQKGGQSANPNGQVVDKSYDDSPASPWSRLRDRSRDPANNAIKEKLPARYRDIVERYYEAANGTPGK
jgi:tetratricopeptide (TPR) repeat protein